MRLRVEVLRHGLPPAKILWQATPDSTASQLLEQIDDVFPLEADEWGLEDYALQSNGYEVLHWMQLGQLLKDDDPVTIRPLQTNDLRARRLSGRHQITNDGRHLVDGVAFGRPLLRRPVRPDLHIPPRKRIRSADHEQEDADDDDEDEDDAEYDDDEELDMLGDYVVEHRDDGDEQLQIEGPPLEEDDSVPDGTLRTAMMKLSKRQAAERTHRKSKRVSFDRASVPPNEDEDEEEEDDDDFEPPPDDEEDEEDEEEEDEDEDMDTNNAEDKGDTGGGASSSSSWNGVNSGAATPVPGLKTTPASGNNSSSDDPSDSSDPSEDSEEESDSDDNSSDGSSAPSEEGIRRQQERDEESTTQKSAPFEGKMATRKRNERRRHTKKLNFLKAQGILPQNATRDHLLAREVANGQGVISQQQSGEDGERKLEESTAGAREPKHASKSSRNLATPASTQKAIDTDQSSSSSSDSGSDSDSDSDSSSSDEEKQSQPRSKTSQKQTSKQKPTTTDLSAAFEAKRAALLAAIATGGVDVQAPLQSEDHPMRLSDIVDMANGSSGPPRGSPPSEAVPRRSKLDVAASQRLLFGSLGVRRPKNDSDRDKLRKTLAAQGKRRQVVLTSSVSSQPAPLDTEVEAGNEDSSKDPNLWKKKINLTAVECVNEDIGYSRPPFPFHQRWDPQMKDKKRKRTSQAFSASKKGKHYNAYQDSYAAEGGDALDYDDEIEYDDNNYFDDTCCEDTDGQGYNNGDAYYDEGNAEEGAAAEAEAQLLRETTTIHPSTTTEPMAEDEDDLPNLPRDLSALPPLTAETALPGTIITFTRLEVSAATRWVPATAPVRIAVIQAVYDDDEGKVLELRLAKRDIPKRQYDGMGRRMFSGFEMDLEDEDDEQGEEVRGLMEVALGEVLEGRVVQPAPEKIANVEAINGEAATTRVSNEDLELRRDESVVAEVTEAAAADDADDADS